MHEQFYAVCMGLNVIFKLISVKLTDTMIILS